MKSEFNSVKVEGNRASLTISYCIPNVESDTNTFSEIASGRTNLSKLSAISSVIEQAKSWVSSLRAQGHEVSAWDDSGNNY